MSSFSPLSAVFRSFWHSIGFFDWTAPQTVDFSGVAREKEGFKVSAELTAELFQLSLVPFYFSEATLCAFPSPF